jgi:type I restriction enzyme S subunit
MVGASGRQRVQEACFKQFKIPQPPQDLLAKFAVVAAPQFALIHSLAQRADNLRRTRDLLLPRLLSGQLDVSKVEQEDEIAA